jgi:hypothetical protein
MYDFCFILLIFILLQFVSFKTNLYVNANIFAKISCYSFSVGMFFLLVFGIALRLWKESGYAPNWLSSIYLQTVPMWLAGTGLAVGLFTLPALLLFLLSYFYKYLKNRTRRIKN